MAEPLLDREVKVTYGSLVIGGAASGTDYSPWGKFDLRIDYPSGRFSMQVLVTGRTDAEFATREAALLAAFRAPNQRLLVEQGSSTRYDFNPATNSGFNQQPNYRLVPDEVQTSRSAVYEVAVDFGVPADATGDSGLRESSILVTAARGEGFRRRMEISGAFTATTTPTAGRAQYLAQIATYEATVQSLVGGSWKLDGKPQEAHDKENKVLRFRRAYVEEVYGTYVAILSEAQFTDQSLEVDIEVSDATPETGHEDATKPTDGLLTFSCSVDKDASTDLASEWTDTVRPHLLTQLGAAFGSFIILRERPQFFAALNRIHATFVVRSYGGVSISELQVRTIDEIDEGVELVPKLDGQPYSYRRFDGPKTWLRTIIRRGVRTLSGSSGGNPSPLFRLGAADGEAPLVDISTPEGFVRLNQQRDGFGYREGIPGSDQELEAFQEIALFQRADTE